MGKEKGAKNTTKEGKEKKMERSKEEKIKASHTQKQAKKINKGKGKTHKELISKTQPPPRTNDQNECPSR